MYSKFLLPLAALFAASLWFGCDDEDVLVPPGGIDPVGSIQIVTECPNDTLKFFAQDSVSIWVVAIATDAHGLALPGVPVDISLFAPQLGVIEFTNPESGTTDSAGRVNMFFRSFAIAGEQIITAGAQGRTTSSALTMIEVPRPQAGFTLHSDRPHDTIFVASDSTLTVNFTAFFADANGNPRREFDGMFISSSATGGHLERFRAFSNGQSFNRWTFRNEYGTFQCRIFGYWLDPFTMLPDTTG